jgi:DNA repair exonuclease SbcCD ATPase subunit
MIVFKSISWMNFLSTGNSANTVLLDKSPTTLIIGRNGEGKSTVLDALCFALFGKPFRNINKGQLVNSINNKNCLVEIKFSIGSNEYRVRRGIKPNIFEIFLNDQLMNQDSANRDYQKILEQQILRLNYKTFTQVVILGSASFVPFMQLPSSQRREVIEDILDIRIFSTMNTLLKDRIQQTKEELIRVESAIQLSKTAVESQQKIIQSLVHSKQEQIDGIRSRIRDNERDIESNSAKVSELLTEVAGLTSRISDFKQLKADITKCDSAHKKRVTKSCDLKETIDFFTANEVCPSCEQGIPHEHKSTIVDKITAEREAIDEERYTLETALEKMYTRLEEIETISTNITELNTEIATLNTSNATLMQQNEKLNSDIQNTQSDTGNINEEKRKLKELATTAISHVDRKTTISEERNMQDIAALLLKDTGIKTAIIREYLPAMNKLINMYLAAMDFYVHFELDESFNEVIKSRFRDEFTYASFSEGEKMRIDLAILFTWRQIAKMKNSVNTNLLILDEIFDSSLDNAGTDYFLSVMSQFEKTNVFVISHKGDVLFDKFRSVIKFEKKNDFSVISQ